MQQLDLQHILKNPSTTIILNQTENKPAAKTVGWPHSTYSPVFWRIRQAMTIPSISNIPENMGSHVMGSHSAIELESSYATN